ncbi:MAG: hypothetical protein ACLP1X_11835 [Polyangiaceae bacterium]
MGALDAGAPIDGGACGTVLTGTDAGTAPMVTTSGPASDAVVLLPSSVTTVDTVSPTRTFGPYTDSAGNIYVSSLFTDVDGGSPKPGIVKIQPDHAIAWTTAYDPGWVVADGKVDPAGNTVIAATLDSPSGTGSSQAVTVKYAPDGTVAWSKEYQLGNATDGFALALGADGSVVTLGSSSLPGSTNGGGILFLVKYAADGTQQWARSYCYGGLVKSAVMDAAGNIYASLGSSGGSVAKFTADGAEVYMTSFPATSDRGPLVFSPDGQSLYLFGNSSAAGTSIGLRKLDPGTGEVSWAMNVATSAATNDPSTGVNWSGQIGNRYNVAITASAIYVAGAYSNSYSSSSLSGGFVTFVAAYDTSGAQKWFQQFQLAGSDGGLQNPSFGGLDNQPYLGADPAGNAVVLDTRGSSADYETVIWKMDPTGALVAF